MRRETLRRLMLVIAIAAIGFVGCDTPGRGHPAVGRGVGPLPVVSLGDPRATAPVLTGKVTLLNFWGTWCPPCRRELPGLARLATQLADEPRFQLVAVSCGTDDIDELAATTAAFLVEQKLPLRPWGFADPPARSLFATAYGLEAFPTTYLIGPDARVRQVWVGYRSRDEADIAQAVLRLLKERPLAWTRVSPPHGRASRDTREIASPNPSALSSALINGVLTEIFVPLRP